MARDSHLCQPCKLQGCVTPATECDHVTPKAKGGTDDLDNLQAICSPCHQEKTQREAAEAAQQLRDEGKASIGADGWPIQPKRWGFSIPDGMRPSQADVTVVCGPPASGKTTFVQQHANKRDTVIDLDAIMVRLGFEPWSANRQAVTRALQYRDKMIRRLADKPNTKAWLIVTAPTRQERAAWLDALGPKADMHIVTADKDTCKQRILADPRRAASAQKQLDVLAWWEA